MALEVSPGDHPARFVLGEQRRYSPSEASRGQLSQLNPG
jgi:hypothetical protein